jgi:hypothetical protein
MMTPLVFLAVRAAAHHDDVQAARPTPTKRVETVAGHTRLAAVRHRPNLTKARRPSWLSRRGVPQTQLP